MKRLLLTAAAVFLLFYAAHPQSGNSNIGTEFWTGWMDHINGAGVSGGSQMNLYIASDVATTGTVSVADGSFTANFSVVPNQITTFAVPASAFLGNTNGVLTKGIHITSVNPIAVYAHIYASSVSGATLLLPVNTLANDYYSLNYTQLSNASPSYSIFMVIGTQDNTPVQITPTAALIDGSAANKPFTITLNKGQVYQGISTTDLTGTRIVSVNNGSTGCQKIAVFSGSNKMYIGKPNTTSDNLFQQVYPTAAWGKNFITVPLKNRYYDVMRIVVSDPAANVTLNGSVLSTATLINNFYYQFNTQAINIISADKPIQVIQYAVTQGNETNGTSTLKGDVGDPEMIYLNPLEQNIANVTLYSPYEYLITASYINVVLPTAAVSSFLLDGAAQAAAFTAVPGNTAYSYAQFTVANTTHNISASQGFNAIAYGFGNAESYGYAAGTNVKNLNEFVQYNNPITNQVATSGCTGTALDPQVILPYQTTSITWDLGNGTTPVVVSNPVVKSTFQKNGITLYLYDYGTPVTYAAGTYAVKVTVVDPITTVCGSNEEINLNFNIAAPATAKFASRDTICVTDTVGFKDLSNGNGSSIQSWRWTFGNGDTSVVQNPIYKYLAPGDYTVGLTVSNPAGCQSAYTKKIHVTPLPTAAFAFSTPDCETLGVTLTDQSTTPEGRIIQWVWNYGDGTPPETRTSGQPFTHTFAKAGRDTVKLQIITNQGCYFTTATRIITIHPHPIVTFNLPDVCLANAVAQFTDQTTIADNSNAQFKYLWNFGDANSTNANANTATIQNPSHQFIKAGTYQVSLTVTTKDTCTITATNTFTVSGQANFTAAASACPADTVLFTDQTDGTNKVISAWHWSFADGDTSALQNPKHAFKNPGDYAVVLTVSGHNGCSTTNFTKSIHINKKPVANFAYSYPDCETQSIQITDKSAAPEGAITAWIWNYGDGTSVETRTSALPFSHTFAKAGTDTIKLRVLTDKGCYSDAATHVITIHPHPVVAFGLPDVCLANAVAQFTDQTTIADNSNGQFKYLWNFGDPNSTAANANTSAVQNPVHQFTKAGTYQVSLTVTSKDTCTVTATNTFTVSGQASFAAAASACPADIVQFTDQTDGTNKVISSWHWNFADGDTSALQNPKHAFKNPGDYAVVLTVSGHNGCSITSFTKGIHINKQPVSNFAFSSPDCETKSIQFTDQSAPAEGIIKTWLWDFGDGSPTSALQNPAHIFTPYKTYVVTLTVTINLGCSAAITKPVIVNPQPVADYTIPDVCLSDAAAIFVAIPDKNGLIYSWNFGDVPGNISARNPNTATGLTVQHHYSAIGAYNATLTVTTTSGFVASVVKQFFVNGSSPMAAFDVVNSANLCSNNEVIFIDNATVPGFGNGNVTSVDMYYDYVNNPTVKVHYERPTVGQVLRNTYPVENSAPRQYTVHMVAYSGAYPGTTCLSTYDKTITLLPVPKITFSAMPAVCQNAGPVNLSLYTTAQGPAGTAKFYQDGNYLASGVFDPSTATLGTHVITYIYTANNTGCADTLKQSITVAPVPTGVSAGAGQEVIGGKSVVLHGKATGTNLTYLWTPSAGLNDPTLLNPIATPVIDTRYKLTVTSTTAGTGCPVSDTTFVRLLQLPLPPNTFTPNGDGVNDTWEIKHINLYPDCTVKVFTRGGELIYSSIGYAVPWDGRYKNAVLPVGTYYYIIDPKRNLSVISGAVNLVK